MLKTIRTWIPVAIMVIALVMSGCQSQQDQMLDTAPGIAVEILSEQCPNIEVRSGEQVTWTNTDDQVHFLRHTPDQGDSQFSSGDLQPGDSFTLVFIEPGTYKYECSEGTGIYGTVVVSP